MTDPVLELLTEHDEVTLELSASGGILVSNRILGTIELAAIADLPAALTEPDAWTAPDLSRGRTNPRDFAPRGTILKASRDEDLYCIWSGNVDNVVAVGTRAEMLAFGIAPSRVARADLYGTSATWWEMPDTYPRPYRPDGWDDEGIVVREQAHAPSNGCGYLPRARLADFLRAYLANDMAAAGALLDLIPEEGDSDA